MAIRAQKEAKLKETSDRISATKPIDHVKPESKPESGTSSEVANLIGQVATAVIESGGKEDAKEVALKAVNKWAGSGEKQDGPNVSGPTSSGDAASSDDMSAGWDASEVMEVALRDKIAEARDEIVDSPPFKVTVGQFRASAARLKACDRMDYGKPKEMTECKIGIYQYNLGPIEPKFKLLPDRKTSIPLCQYSPGTYSLATIDRVPAEISCRHLLLAAIHEQFEWQLKNPEIYRKKLVRDQKPKTPPSKAELKCKEGLASIERDMNAKIKNSPQGGGVPQMELLMGGMETSIAFIDANCSDSANYQVARRQFYQTLNESKVRCDALASAPPSKPRR